MKANLEDATLSELAVVIDNHISTTAPYSMFENSFLENIIHRLEVLHKESKNKDWALDQLHAELDPMTRTIVRLREELDNTAGPAPKEPMVYLNNDSFPGAINM